MENTPITYYQDNVVVNVGDYVKVRILFRWKIGRVVYVPGVSMFNPNMEYNGLQWVGIQIDDGPFLGVVVDPNTKTIKKTVQFIDRGEAAELSPDADPFAE
jgi:hypothetical protein